MSKNCDKKDKKCCGVCLDADALMVDKAINCINAMMKRNKMALKHVMAAVGMMYRRKTADVIMEMRNSGHSIRSIARKLHIDDRRVSAIIKDMTASPMEVAKASCKKSDKARMR